MPLTPFQELQNILNLIKQNELDAAIETMQNTLATSLSELPHAVFSMKAIELTHEEAKTYQAILQLSIELHKNEQLTCCIETILKKHEMLPDHFFEILFVICAYPTLNDYISNVLYTTYFSKLSQEHAGWFRPFLQLLSTEHKQAFMNRLIDENLLCTLEYIWLHPQVNPNFTTLTKALKRAMLQANLPLVNLISKICLHKRQHTPSLLCESFMLALRQIENQNNLDELIDSMLTMTEQIIAHTQSIEYKIGSNSKFVEVLNRALQIKHERLIRYMLDAFIPHYVQEVNELYQQLNIEAYSQLNQYIPDDLAYYKNQSMVPTTTYKNKKEDEGIVVRTKKYTVSFQATGKKLSKKFSSDGSGSLKKSPSY